MSNSNSLSLLPSTCGQHLNTNATPHGAGNGDNFPGKAEFTEAFWRLYQFPHGNVFRIACQKCTTHGLTPQSTSHYTLTMSSPGDPMLGMNCSMSSCKRPISNGQHLVVSTPTFKCVFLLKNLHVKFKKIAQTIRSM